MRYFLVAYSFSTKIKHGNGNLWFSSDSFPSNDFLKEMASGGGQTCGAGDVVVSHITELSEADFNAFCGNE